MNPDPVWVCECPQGHGDSVIDARECSLAALKRLETYGWVRKRQPFEDECVEKWDFETDLPLPWDRDEVRRLLMSGNYEDTGT